jgi:hypothetical protein
MVQLTSIEPFFSCVQMNPADENDNLPPLIEEKESPSGSGPGNLEVTKPTVRFNTQIPLDTTKRSSQPPPPSHLATLIITVYP